MNLGQQSMEALTANKELQLFKAGQLTDQLLYETH